MREGKSESTASGHADKECRGELGLEKKTELELLARMSCHVGAGHGIQLLW